MNQTLPSDSPSLLYVGDPMCSWCYGFAVPLQQTLAAFPGVQLDIVLGGLRAYNTEVMTDELKTSLRHHWQEVQRRSGQPFDAEALLLRDDFVYDTEPACRAVATAKEIAPEHAVTLYHAIQDAFYAHGQDVTQADVLAAIWAEVCEAHSVEPSAGFLSVFESVAMRDIVREDFELTQTWGVRGFPALLVVANGEANLVASGYTEAEVLISRIQAAFDAAR